MKVKINKHYKGQMDKMQKEVVKPAYPFYLICIAVAIYEAFFQVKGVSIIVLLLYTIPLVIGICFELFATLQYNKIGTGLEKFRKSVVTNMLKTINYGLLMITFFLYIGIGGRMNALYTQFKGRVNFILLSMLVATLVIFLLTFFIGTKAETSILKKDKNMQKKLYIVCGVAGLLGVAMTVILVRKVPILYFALGFIVYCAISAFGIGIGREYFSLKNCDKKIFPEDVLFTYEFKDKK